MRSAPSTLSSTSTQLFTTSSYTSTLYSSSLWLRQRWITWLPLESELSAAMLPRNASMMSFSMSGWSWHIWISFCTERVPCTSNEASTILCFTFRS